MANQFHESVLREGAASWNRTRPRYFGSEFPTSHTDGELQGLGLDHPDFGPDEIYEEIGELIRAPDLTGLRFGGDLQDYDLSHADLSDADLSGARLMGTDFSSANLRNADLSRSNLTEARFNGADLTGANLSLCVLENSSLVRAHVEGARFTGSRVYGVSVWGLRGTAADESDLIVTPRWQRPVPCDDLRVAQFLELVLNNAEIRNVIDVMRVSCVLILGRFNSERLPVLRAIKDRLRAAGMVPVLFDFSRPDELGFGDTVDLLARIARCVIADITDATEVRSELARIAPIPNLTVIPIIERGRDVYATFDTDVAPYPWVRPVTEYESTDQIVAELAELIPSSLQATEQLHPD